MQIYTVSELPRAVDFVSSSQPFVQVERAITQPGAENRSWIYCTIITTHFVAASFSKAPTTCCETMQVRTRKRLMHFRFMAVIFFFLLVQHLLHHFYEPYRFF